MKNKNVLARVVNVCSKIVGEKQASLHELYESRAMRKGRKIAGDSAHILARHFKRYRMRRTRTLRAENRTRTLRAENSVVPSSITLCNLRI